jgi:hypothetical protein
VELLSLLDFNVVVVLQEFRYKAHTDAKRLIAPAGYATDVIPLPGKSDATVIAVFLAEVMHMISLGNNVEDARRDGSHPGPC